MGLIVIAYAYFASDILLEFGCRLRAWCDRGMAARKRVAK